MVYYAVREGYIPGIYTTWTECNKQVKGFSKATYKKFTNISDAESFLKSGKVEIVETPADITVFTDGGCYGNGKVISFGGYGIYFSDSDSRNKGRPISGKCTNNIAELTAILKVFKILDPDIKDGKKVLIVTDSLYSIQALTISSIKYENDGWINDFPNKHLIKMGYAYLKKHNNITFRHVYAHTNLTDKYSLGNSNG